MGHHRKLKGFISSVFCFQSNEDIYIRPGVGASQLVCKLELISVLTIINIPDFIYNETTDHAKSLTGLNSSLVSAFSLEIVLVNFLIIIRTGV